MKFSFWGKTALVGALLWIFLGSAAWAGGSFSLDDDLMPILNQAPVVKEYLLGSLELAPTGSANRLGNNVNPRLGGQRVGPYVLLAKPKGAAGPETLEITVNTELNYLNAAGKTVELPKAHSVKEKFQSVEIRPYTEN